MSKRRPEGPVTLTPTREHVKNKRRGGRRDADALEETGRTEKSSSVGASTTDTGRRAPRRQISGGDLGGQLNAGSSATAAAAPVEKALPTVGGAWASGEFWTLTDKPNPQGGGVLRTWINHAGFSRNKVGGTFPKYPTVVLSPRG